MEPLPEKGTSPAPTKWIDPLAVIVWLIPLAYLLFSYPSLPDKVPMHFDGNGRPNEFGSKSAHLVIMLGMWVFNIAIYLVLRNVHRLDPKAVARTGGKVFRNLAQAILLFLSILHVAIVYATVVGGFVVDRLILLLLGGLFSYLGWIMNDIAPNYFVGIRTPWTLEDPENWKATHRMGSKWFLWGGVLIMLIALILPRPYTLFVGIITLLVIAFAPIVYSYRFFNARSRSL